MTPRQIYNILTLQGDPMEIEKFRNHAEGIDPCVLGRFELNDLCFNNFVALPRSIIAGSSIISMEQARMERWGCCSDALGVSLDHKKDKLVYRFTTGRESPEKVLQVIKKLYGHELEIKHETRD